MKKNSRLPFIFVIFFIACADNPKINSNTSSSEPSEMKLKSKVVEILKTCTSTPGPGESIYNNDTLSFVIYPGGFAKNGVAYRSFNAISGPWAYCIERQVMSTNFSPLGEGSEYSYHSSVDWDAALSEHPELLTPKVKIKKQMRNSESQFQNCYTSYRDSGGKEQGKVNIMFEVLPEGKVKNINALSEEIKDKAFLKCISSTVSKIQFLKTKENSKVLYPIIFKL